MTRRIILILVGALVVLALMFALWFWLFGKQAEVENNLGGFGSAEDREGGLGSGAGGGGNDQAPIGSTGTSDTSNVQTPLYVSPTYYTRDYSGIEGPDVPDRDFSPRGVSWLDGSSGGGGSGSSGSGGGSVAFNPTSINDVNTVNIEGTAYFVNSPSGAGGSGGVGLGGALLGVAGGCVANYLTQKTASVALNKVFSTVNNFLNSITFGFFGSDEVYDPINDANQTTSTFIECMVRSLARIAIRQITAQTVDWINSGFDGEPAFVQNFGQFFTDVADEAAGEFIQGSDLAFLCSPFQLQVRIAIAQSYARRSSGAAASACTLSSAVNNIENFMRGNFKEGGWPGLISFTTVPTNNPFGAYVNAQVLLQSRVEGEKELASLRISPGGFLSREECDINPTTGFETCQIVTPGSTFETALEATFKTNLDSLQLADSIDEIISALINSLISNVFQKGLANLSGSDVGGLPTEDTVAAGEAGELLQLLQAAAQRAQQYGGVQQGSIQDIHTAQSNLTTLQNCWSGKGNSSNAQAAANQKQTLETRISTYNNNITRANSAIARVLQIQTQALSATNVTDVRATKTALTQAESSGALITASELTLAQQNRTTLQAEMAAINQQTSLQLNQCHAS